MDERERKRKVREELERSRAGGKARKKYSRREPSLDQSASQAVLDGVGTKRGSKKINYDVLQGAFAGDGSIQIPSSMPIASASTNYSSSSISSTSLPVPAAAPGSLPTRSGLVIGASIGLTKRGVRVAQPSSFAPNPSSAVSGDRPTVVPRKSIRITSGGGNV
jgi:Brf1-like TBP-binding domain